MWLPVAAMWLTSQFPTLYTKGHIVMSPMNITSHIIMWVLGLVLDEIIGKISQEFPLHGIFVRGLHHATGMALQFVIVKAPLVLENLVF